MTKKLKPSDQRAIDEAASALMEMRLDAKEVGKPKTLSTNKGKERFYKMEVNDAGKPRIVEVE